MPKILNRLYWQHACYTHHSFLRTGACGLIVMSIIPVIMPHENKAKTVFTDSLKKNFDCFLMVSSAQKLINFQGNTLNIHPAEFLLRSILLTTQLLRSPLPKTGAWICQHCPQHKTRLNLLLPQPMFDFIHPGSSNSNFLHGKNLSQHMKPLPISFELS